jgi:predicted PurR-regulated permease PerM
MLGIDSRALKSVWTGFLFITGIAVIYIVRDTLVTFALAVFFALLLAPIVATVERLSPPWLPRTAALTIVYVLLMGAIAAITIPLASAVADDARVLAQKLPDAISKDTIHRIPLPAILEPARDRLSAELEKHLDDLERDAFPLLSRAFEQLVTGIGTVGRFVFVPILAFFILKDGRTLYGQMIVSVSGKRRNTIIEIYSDLRVLLAQYVRALMILSLITFLVYALFLAITGAPYAVLLAGLAAVCEIVPAVGPFIAALTILAVVILSGYTKWLLLLGFLVVYRVFLDYMVQPTLMSSGVQVHPILVMFGALAGGEIAGIAGVFFSIPVIATLRVIVMRLHAATKNEPSPIRDSSD